MVLLDSCLLVACAFVVMKGLSFAVVFHLPVKPMLHVARDCIFVFLFWFEICLISVLFCAHGSISSIGRFQPSVQKHFQLVSHFLLISDLE